MSLITYVPSGSSSPQGQVNAGGGVEFDVGAALSSGGGQFTVDSGINPTLVGILDHFPGLMRSGSAPGPPVNVDSIGFLVAHQGNPQTSDLLVRGSDGLFAPAQKLPVGSSPGSWLGPSPLGSAQRSAVELLMSTFDTNAATSDHTAVFQAALAAAAALVVQGASVVRIILDSRQKYTISGAVQAGAHGEWAQIPLPYSNAIAGTIKLVGMPRGNDYSYIGGGNSGTVIESTLSSAPSYVASRGIASILGGPASFSSAHIPTTMYSGGGFNWLRFMFQDITIRSAAPVICGIDAGWCTGFGIDGLLQFDRDDLAAANPALNLIEGLAVQLNAPCTAPQAIPLITPFHLDWYGTLADTLVCSGWVGGPMLGEFGHFRRIFVFYTAGAALYLDACNQATRIEYLIDWNNAYGIAAPSPTSATPIAPTATGAGSNTPASPATPVDIGVWEVQTSQGGGFASSTNRVYDVIDPNNVAYIDCPSWVSTTDGNAFNPAPIILGFGSSLTGRSGAQRIKNKFQAVSGASPALPATGVAIRNPYGRDALVQLNGGTVTSVTVNDFSVLFTTVFAVPANAVVAVAYTGSPTWKWQIAS